MKDEEKQIEEMANDLRKSEHWYFDDTDCDFELDRKKTAENLYTAGYRKQSEWISVEERLPEADTDVLVITCHGSFKVARCNIYHNGTLVLWMTNDGLGEKAITHWMPLPEAPKGGAE